MKFAFSAFRDKKYAGAFAAGFLWGVLVASVSGVIYLRSSLLREYQSKVSFEETCARIASSVSGTAGWQAKRPPCVLPKTGDGSNMAQISLCNAKFAKNMLDDENGRKVAAVIPCCFAVYQKKDGKTYVSRLDTRIFGLILGDKAGNVFSSQIAPDQENVLRDIVK